MKAKDYKKAAQKLNLFSVYCAYLNQKPNIIRLNMVNKLMVIEK